MEEDEVYFVFGNVDTDDIYDVLVILMFASGQISGMTLKKPNIIVCPQCGADLRKVRFNAERFLQDFPDCTVTERSLI